MSPILSRLSNLGGGGNGGFGLGKKNRSIRLRPAKKYFPFNSPGTLDLSPIPQIQQVDYFSITSGGGGGSGAPGIPLSDSGGTGGDGGSSGYVSVSLNQLGGSPAPISIGTNYPTPISGPNPGPSGTNLTIPQAVKDVFSDYTITTYSQGSGGTPGGDGFAGDGGSGGAGGLNFSSKGTLPSAYLPSVPGNSASPGGTGSTVTSQGGNAYRYGGTGGAGGSGYGAGGGGGGGGAEYDGNTSGGAGGGGGSGGLIVVKVTYLEEY